MTQTEKTRREKQSEDSKPQINLKKIDDRELLKMLYQQQGYIQSLQNQLSQAQTALQQINAEGQRRAMEEIK